MIVARGSGLVAGPLRGESLIRDVARRRRCPASSPLPRAMAVLISLSLFTVLSLVTYRDEANRFMNALERRLSDHGIGATSPSDVEAKARARLVRELFVADLDYPPTAVTLVLNKATHVLDLYAKATDEPWRFVRAYRLPERARLNVADGLYRLAALDANIGIELASVDEPSSRLILGAGRSPLRMARDATEELYTLAAATGIDNVRLLVTPRDYRIAEGALLAARPDEKGELYTRIKDELSFLKVPAPAPLAGMKSAKPKQVTPGATRYDDEVLMPLSPPDPLGAVNQLTVQGL